MAQKILEVKNLNIKLGGEDIIKDLSFEVEEGDVFTILGPNGAGKTTLFRALLGMVPYTGEIIWSEEKDNRRPKMGYIPERLSREKFREAPVSTKEFFRFKNSSDREILEILKEVGLSKKVLNKSPADLSSGQFQRVLVAWSLIGDPRILLFDEPTSGIDIKGEEAVYSLLGKIWKKENMSVFLISHDLNIVHKHSNKVLCLNKKKISLGSPKEMLTSEVLKKLYGSDIKFHLHHHS